MKEWIIEMISSCGGSDYDWKPKNPTGRPQDDTNKPEPKKTEE